MESSFITDEAAFWKFSECSWINLTEFESCYQLGLPVENAIQPWHKQANCPSYFLSKENETDPPALFSNDSPVVI